MNVFRGSRVFIRLRKISTIFGIEFLTNAQYGGAFQDNIMVGVIAFREDWIEQFYILPDTQRCGIGRGLLLIVQTHFLKLSPWTFQRNAPRRFYEAQGFVVMKETDGASNEEREPDVFITGNEFRQLT